MPYLSFQRQVILISNSVNSLPLSHHLLSCKGKGRQEAAGFNLHRLPVIFFPLFRLIVLFHRDKILYPDVYIEWGSCNH